MAEAVKVIVRCRPMNARENGLKCKDVIFINERLAQCSIKNPNDDKGPPKAFTFDGAYGVNSTTQQIYAEIGFPLVEGVTEGYNGTIFAYGQTGSGKSFSMQGITDPATQKGVIPRAFDHVFEKIQVTEGAKYLVHASYLEIYNEEIRDLLGKDIKQKLELKEHPDKGVYVQSLSMHLCKNVRMCEQVMERGWKNRSTGATLMNADSSRSHSIFTIHLERAETDGKGEDHIRVAKLNLVDLAGSERQGKTGATGDRLKEATKINLSLSALGNVISALVDGKSTHIPYRDSKLTRMLQDSLGGNTKTLMVACLSPADNNYEETLSTLRYANRAKNIKNKPKINEDPKDALLREFQEEIKRLKAMLSGQIPVQLPPEFSPVDDNQSDRTELAIIVDRERDTDDLTMQSDEIISDDNRQMPASKTSNVVTRHPDDVTKRLEELEQTMVGGEEFNNEEVKARHQKKKKFAEDRSKQLRDALALMDGEEIMIGIYENVQDKLKTVEKKLKKETERSELLKSEIDDLQSEFELDRRDYLDTIRKQEMQIKWLEGVIDRIHPTLQSACNFSNLDGIRAQSKWDEDEGIWTMPKLTIEEVQLPSTSSGALVHSEPTMVEAIHRAIDKERQKLKQEFEKEARRVKQESTAVKFKCYEIEVDLFNLRGRYDDKFAKLEKIAQEISPVDDHRCNQMKLPPKMSGKKRKSENTSSSCQITPKSKQIKLGDSNSAEVCPSAKVASKLPSISTKKQSTSEVSSNLTATTSKVLPKSFPNLQGVNCVVFVDIDNWNKDFPKLLSFSPSGVLFWLIFGGKCHWSEPLHNPAYSRAKSAGRVFLNKKCGTSKEAADVAICLMVGRMDMLKLNSVPFIILSGDRGFLELEEQFSDDWRHLCVICPHSNSVVELRSVIRNIINV